MVKINKDLNVSTYLCPTDDQLLVLLLDLFMAGSETTSNSLSFSILYLVRYPDVQKKIQQEIDSLEKEPTILDRYK